MAVYSNAKESSFGYSETKEMIVLRKVVHELLLSSGDSISRVLPVKQISVAEFHLFPEKPFSVKPDSFVNIVNRTIKAGLLTRNFTARPISPFLPKSPFFSGKVPLFKTLLTYFPGGDFHIP